jgi:DNA-binding MarR family transcriptional regulator
MRRGFLERAAKTGLTQTQARALAVLSLHEGESQVDLARRLDIHPMTFARLLDRMEASGLIERRRDPLDRRAFMVFLGPRAGPALSHLAMVSEDLRQLALEGFAKSEHDLLVRYLERLKDNVAQFSAPQPARRPSTPRIGAA